MKYVVLIENSNDFASNALCNVSAENPAKLVEFLLTRRFYYECVLTFTVFDNDEKEPFMFYDTSDDSNRMAHYMGNKKDAVFMQRVKFYTNPRRVVFE